MNILEEAMALTDGDRQDAYGHPLDDFTKTAAMWEQVLGVTVTAEQMALCMILVKVSRLTHKYKRDSVVDIAGYANTLQMLIDERERRKCPDFSNMVIDLVPEGPAVDLRGMSKEEFDRFVEHAREERRKP